MIEFTISRVILCVCGTALILTVSGALGAIYDGDTDEMDDRLAERLAYMMDVFQSSGNDTIILEGSRILPEGYTMAVHDGFVELISEKGKHIAMTTYNGQFTLDCDDILVVTRRTSLLSS